VDVKKTVLLFRTLTGRVKPGNIQMIFTVKRYQLGGLIDVIIVSTGTDKQYSDKHNKVTAGTKNAIFHG